MQEWWTRVWHPLCYFWLCVLAPFRGHYQRVCVSTGSSAWSIRAFLCGYNTLARPEGIYQAAHLNFPNAVCNNASSMLVDFQQGAQSALVECSSLHDYKWWRSNSSCEPSSFTPYPDCIAQNCHVPLATSMVDFYMYFCCTSSNVSSLEGIQFQRCTQIQGEWYFGS